MNRHKPKLNGPGNDCATKTQASGLKRKARHKEGTPYHCHACGAGFFKLQALEGHMNKHKRPKPSHDPEDGCTTKDQACLLVRSANLKQGAVYACNVCGLGFFKQQALGGHMNKHKQKLKKQQPESGEDIANCAASQNRKNTGSSSPHPKTPLEQASPSPFQRPLLSAEAAYSAGFDAGVGAAIMLNSSGGLLNTLSMIDHVEKDTDISSEERTRDHSSSSGLAPRLCNTRTVDFLARFPRDDQVGVSYVAEACPLKSNPHECSSASANFGLPKLQPRGGAFLGMPTSNGFKQPYHLTGTKIAAEAEQRRKGFNLAQPSALLVGVMPLKGAILKLVVLKS